MPIHNLGLAATLLQDGDLEQIEIEDKSFVLARRNGQYFAFGANCTHYGAPLEKGVLHDYTVMCPWHHACFDIRTGIRQEPPALDSLQTYPVSIVDGEVRVELEPADKPDIEPKEADKTIIIVGGGAAGEAAAEELRRSGFAGELILLSASEDVPVDRPNLSKDYLAGEAKAEWMPLRDRAWYEENEIDLQLETRVTSIDPDAYTITTDAGKDFHYDKLLLATGSHPRILHNVNGVEMDNVFTLRDKADADRIIQQVGEDQQVVIIGASFIGMEVAASLGERDANVSVIEVEEVPFEATLGGRVGRFLQRLHESNGVRFYLNTSVKEFRGDDGHVTEVELSDGTRLPADLVILGIGVQPATDYLSDSDISMNEKDHAILVDKYLQTSQPDIYAAGDIARYPNRDGSTTRIEHWRTAQQHGFVAAHNMLHHTDNVNAHIPFFWTSQWGTRLRYVGHAQDWDDIVYRGNVEEGKFIAYYLKDQLLQAAAGVGYDAELDALEFVLLHDLPLSVQDMQNPEFNIVALASEA